MSIAAPETRAGPASLVLGRYRPLRPLGSGGSGSVWLVRDEDAGREVALKIVRREGKAGSRAEREVEAATRLRHPRCLRALALDRDEEHVYVAYEFVRGRTLRDALRSGQLDDAATIEACAQVLEALAHAHAKGVLHRDVKPANVMLEDGGGVSARLLDFGLARVEDAETLTAAGDVPGTLAYVAPERLEGGPVDGAADVWSVGVILWEALTGWHPFSASSPVETARRISNGPPALAKSRPDLPAELCALVHRMLERDPRRRPSVKRLATALREAADERARRPRHASSRRVLRERAVHAALAAVYAGGSTLVLPFFPRGWPLLIALATGLAALRAPRAGLALALATPVLPLGNVSLGLAIAYGLLALAWLALFARDAVNSLLFVASAALAPIGGLGVAPAVAARARGTVRRIALGAAATLTAAGVAVAAGFRLPLGGDEPRGLEIDPTASPSAAFAAVADALAAHPVLVFEAALLALAAVAAPLALRRGAWGAAIWGSALLAAGLLVPPLADFGDVSALHLAPGAIIGTAWLGFRAIQAPNEAKRGGQAPPLPGAAEA